MSDGTIPGAEALPLETLITPTEKGIASRVLAKAGGGNVTIFAFDRGQGLSEHTAPFDARPGACRKDDAHDWWKDGGRGPRDGRADAGGRPARPRGSVPALVLLVMLKAAPV
jgi:hypothetical protein